MQTRRIFRLKMRWMVDELSKKWSTFIVVVL